MTDFKKDAINFLDLMSTGTIEKLKIYINSDYYVIETEEEVFLYDIITEKEIL